MPNTNDGGYWALAGYLYQIVGLLGMRALANRPSVIIDSSELEALLTLVADSQLHHEYLGQDAVLEQLGLRDKDELVLVQFKYSTQIPPRSIQKAELKGIIDRLNTSAQAALAIGQKVTGYTLITNRSLSPGARDLREAVGDGDDPGSLSEEQSETLRRLRIITDLPLSQWQNALTRFAQEFGATETEIDGGTSRLIGDLVSKTVQGDVSITEADLIHAFTEFEETRRLTYESIGELSIPQLQRFIDQHNLPGQPVRRKLLDELGMTARQRALVLLCGLGGCGKTVALWQWAQETATAPDPHNKPSIVVSAAGMIPRIWITEVICNWANVPSVNHRRRGESQELALHRLCTATPGASRPVLFMGLDGLDEDTDHPEQQHIIREVLNWFWEKDRSARENMQIPEATLIVTCREAEEVRRWLRLDASGYGYHGEGPADITADDFTLEELLQAARIGIPALSSRIEATARALRDSNRESTVASPELIAVGDAFAPKADIGLLESLAHPAMWRALLELSHDTQIQALDRKDEAINQLAEVFVGRFCNKVMRRDRIAGLKEENLLDILSGIARHCQANGRARQAVADWIDPACDSDWIRGPGEARILHSETLSGGMILKDDEQHWRWRHPFVGDYLAAVDVV